MYPQLTETLAYLKIHKVSLQFIFLLFLLKYVKVSVRCGLCQHHVQKQNWFSIYHHMKKSRHILGSKIMRTFPQDLDAPSPPQKTLVTSYELSQIRNQNMEQYRFNDIPVGFREVEIHPDTERILKNNSVSRIHLMVLNWIDNFYLSRVCIMWSVSSRQYDPTRHSEHWRLISQHERQVKHWIAILELMLCLLSSLEKKLTDIKII